MACKATTVPRDKVAAVHPCRVGGMSRSAKPPGRVSARNIYDILLKHMLSKQNRPKPCASCPKAFAACFDFVPRRPKPLVRKKCWDMPWDTTLGQACASQGHPKLRRKVPSQGRPKPFVAECEAVPRSRRKVRPKAVPRFRPKARPKVSVPRPSQEISFCKK